MGNRNTKVKPVVDTDEDSMVHNRLVAEYAQTSRKPRLVTRAAQLGRLAMEKLRCRKTGSTIHVIEPSPGSAVIGPARSPAQLDRLFSNATSPNENRSASTSLPIPTSARASLNCDQYALAALSPDPNASAAERVDSWPKSPASSISHTSLEPYVPHLGSDFTATAEEIVVEKANPLEAGGIQGLSWEGSVRLATGDFSEIYQITYKNVPAALKLKCNNGNEFSNIELIRPASMHPNILPLYAYSSSDLHTITISPLAVCDLQRLIRFGHGLPYSVHETLLYSVYHALRHLRNIQIAHRDLKPENVLLLRDGTPQLAGFGSAGRFIEDTLTCGDDVPVRTLQGCAAPELMHRGWSGHASDIWALGVLLCTFLNGRNPYDIINDHLGRGYGDATYNPHENLAYFLQMDFMEQYCATKPELTVLQACFTVDPFLRLERIDAAIDSEYFSDVDKEYVHNGFRIKQWHSDMQRLVEDCIEGDEDEDLSDEFSELSRHTSSCSLVIPSPDNQVSEMETPCDIQFESPSDPTAPALRETSEKLLGSTPTPTPSHSEKLLGRATAQTPNQSSEKLLGRNSNCKCTPTAQSPYQPSEKLLGCNSAQSIPSDDQSSEKLLGNNPAPSELSANQPSEKLLGSSCRPTALSASQSTEELLGSDALIPTDEELPLRLTLSSLSLL